MTARNIITISESPAGQLLGALQRADVNLQLPDWRDALPLQLGNPPLPQLTNPQLVAQYGSILRNALMGHPILQYILNQAFMAPPGQAKTLCFKIHAPAGEAVRWEALCDNANNFVAPQGICRIGRIAEGMTTLNIVLRPISVPLRLVAFISAAKIDGAEQCRLLIQSVNDAIQQGLKIEAKLFIGQPNLLNQLTQAGQSSAIQLAPMPIDHAAVEAELDRLKPHFIHFFCHGVSQAGSQHLQLATLNDWNMNAAAGSVIVSLDTLSNSCAGFRNSWLVILNCCVGAQATADLASMTYQVVARGGIPAAIGMLEPIDGGDADVICRSLYPPLFTLVRQGFAEAELGAAVEIDFTPILGPTRRALLNQHLDNPDNGNRWTLPVLYQLQEGLQVFSATSSPAAAPAPVHAPKPAAAAPASATLTPEDIEDMYVRVTTIAKFLRSLPPSTPQNARLQALALLDQPPSVPLELRPDEMGVIKSPE